MKRVVVTGIGAITPIGNNIDTYLSGLQQGVSGANMITLFDATLFKTRFACEVKGFVAEDYLDRREVRRIDRFTQFAMVSAGDALQNSGLDLEVIDKDRVGVIWASGIGGLATLEKEIEEHVLGNGTPKHNPFLIPKMISDIAAGQISIQYGFRGINYATVSACASSSHALMNAYDYIRLGKANIVVTGGSEATITKTAVGGFNSMKALSERNDEFETASRPYDKDRDGFVLGEGAGALILEEYEHARKRGARIYAEVVGAAATADAYHITAPHPEGAGVINVMNFALEDAGMNPEDIDYINTHGTSTPLGDIAELKAIEKVFGGQAAKMNISSTKSMTGHLLGAAGAIEAIACILAMNHDFAPPTINHFTDDPDINPALNLTFREAQQRKIRAALSNTFGFGGHNASVIFRQV
ncbi:MAG: beta-ketoacyl-ACP synthase II [Lewinellaceae bacterium]|nr:beta-ketoacyl-ACP synthase II [Saprospiraceae bacterium]MCB0543487.1 beta-ketoacyl-ACP synthase II [Saprospiraceae bacterium]MCB9305055.1 beta-ketoacyl-ACP synthase II [Lewinellaceae bacterium]MCB9353333.1 beta-ketoacyl-ACP synthase II [Lewinellaceae bacterium]